jgi:hypothetical protein
MKGDKAGRGGGGGRLPQQQAPPPLRLESRRFRLLSIVVGCFVFCIVFLLSSRPDATAFDTGQCLYQYSSSPTTTPIIASRRGAACCSRWCTWLTRSCAVVVACSEPQGVAGGRAPPAGRRQDPANRRLRRLR